MNTLFKTSYIIAMLLLMPFFSICNTNNALVNDSNLVEELLLRNYAEEQLHIMPENYSTLSAVKKAQLFTVGGWLRGIWNALTGDDYGKYREPRHNGDGPYMTFQYNEYNDLQHNITNTFVNFS